MKRLKECNLELYFITHFPIEYVKSFKLLGLQIDYDHVLSVQKQTREFILLGTLEETALDQMTFFIIITPLSDLC